MAPRLVLAVLLLAAEASAQEPTGAIVGTLTDVTGASIPRADVTIDGPVPIASRSTDASGEFVIDSVPRGTYTLRFQSPGFTPKKVTVVVEDTGVKSLGRVTLEVVPPPPCLGDMKPTVFHETKLRSGGKSSVSGIAIEGGVAMAKFVITLRTADTHEVIGTTRTDEQGRFQFAEVAAGSYELLSGGPIVKLIVRKGHDLDVRLTWAGLPNGEVCL